MAPPPDRPRERLWRLGAGALTAPELLAILLGTGQGGEDVLRVAGRLLDSANKAIDLLAIPT